jgi:hypothetical protein
MVIVCDGLPLSRYGRARELSLEKRSLKLKTQNKGMTRIRFAMV